MRQKNINILQDTLTILSQGHYYVNSKKAILK